MQVIGEANQRDGVRSSGGCIDPDLFGLGHNTTNWDSQRCNIKGGAHLGDIDNEFFVKCSLRAQFSFAEHSGLILCEYSHTHAVSTRFSESDASHERTQKSRNLLRLHEHFDLSRYRQLVNKWAKNSRNWWGVIMHGHNDEVSAW